MEGNWQKSWKACESRFAQADPYWNPCVDIYVGMRAVCQGAFRPKIKGLLDLRRSYGYSIEAPVAPRSEIWKASITTAATRIFTYNPRCHTRLFPCLLAKSSIASTVRPHLAMAQAGNFSFSIRYSMDI
jgi:hypothetical protein